MQMTRAPRRLVALLLAGGVASASASAHAFCRTKTCDTEPSYGDAWEEAPQPTECVRNAQGCLLDGTPLYWPSSCISFAVQRDGSESSGLDFATTEAIVQEAFDKWAAVDCGGGTPSFRIEPLGRVECGRAEYNQDAGNANVFLFRDDDWPYANAGDALALTTLTFNIETAEIYDADVELNSAQTLFTTSDEPAEIVSDLASVVTHEAGHFLGLSHSAVETAVMRATGYRSGSVDMRVLTDDDHAGICEIFPPGSEPSGSCRPRHGFGSQCGSEQPKESGGCTLSRAASARDARLHFLVVAFAGAFLVRRTRRRRRG
jgi:hypothetical protein